MAMTNNPYLAEQMILHRSHGITNKAERMVDRPSDEIWNYQQIDIGFNHRMTDIQAALGISQLKRIPNFLVKRRQIATRYDSKLANLPVILPKQRSQNQSSFHLYPIRIRHSLCNRVQRQVYNSLTQAGIGANLHYIPVYRQPYYSQLGFPLGYCEESEIYYKETISLPMFSGLSISDQEKVIDSLNIIL